MSSNFFSPLTSSFGSLPPRPLPAFKDSHFFFFTCDALPKFSVISFSSHKNSLEIRLIWSSRNFFLEIKSFDPIVFFQSMSEKAVCRRSFSSKALVKHPHSSLSEPLPHAFATMQGVFSDKFLFMSLFPGPSRIVEQV